MKTFITAVALTVAATSSMAQSHKENLQTKNVNGFHIECYTHMMNDLKWCYLSSGNTEGSIQLLKNVYRDNDYCLDIVGHDYPGRKIGEVRVGDESEYLFSGDPLGGMPVSCHKGLHNTNILSADDTIKVSYAKWPYGTRYAKYSISGIEEAIQELETMAKAYKNK